MDTEEAFQAHLDKNPDDHTARMVFADWLEERGDCEKLLLEAGDPFQGDHWEMMQRVRAAVAKHKPSN